MNGVNGGGGPSGLWQEARNADGRVYYYNVQTKETQWAKPVDLMTPQERALSNQPWKEYTAEGGRKYWYNTETKTSTWEMPEVYKQALGPSQPSSLPAKPETPTTQFVAGGSFGAFPEQDRAPVERQLGWGQSESQGASRGPAFQKASGPDYNTYEEAEAAFFKLLRRSGVGSDWTWEQTIRATVQDPQFQSVKDPRDRKTAFEKYVSDLKIQERDRAKERLEKLKADFGKMLRSHQEIKHYTRWKTARPILEREAIFRSTDDENERRQLFEEYIIELKKAHAEQEAARRKSAMDELVTILKNLDLEPYTRWSDARNQIENNARFAGDEKFRSLTKIDVLTAFENHIKALERTFNDERQKEKQSKTREERKNRDAFIDLLKELRADGKIKAGTKWSTIHPLVAEDARFHAILGQPGSGPLDLFRDLIEEEERSLRLVRNEVYDVLEDRRYEVTPKTTFAEFEKLMKSEARTASIPTETLELLFSRLMEKVARRAEEDKHASERHTRRAVDALRSRIKRLDPPVRPDSTWEQIRPKIADFSEFNALESEEQRKSAFEKVLRRVKEKEEDLVRERERAEHRPPSRGGGRDRRTRASRGSFSPERKSPRAEPDAYEADRKKAMADRERQYRKGGPGAGGLSPTGRERERERDRDREREREPRSAGGDRFVPRRDEGRLRDGRDRERERDRDRERDPGRDRERRRRSSIGDDDDRSYRPRGDTWTARDNLDYDGLGGDRYGGSGRRRRQDSEGAESLGSTRKRARWEDDRKRDREDGREKEREPEKERKRDKEKEKEKERAKDKEQEKEKEETAMHSGSEEGEMVED